jgi:murein DD-endopeptidase MepM/ murein hydrolase activator NlpD
MGQPVSTAFDGQVVAAVDRVPERARIHLVRELALVVNNMVTFDPARRGLDPVAGNLVTVHGADAVALFAHLAPETVPVTTGQVVRAGELIGRVGHTGNSTAPHLHVQVMDSADPLQAKGIPCAFEAYLVQGDGGWERVECGIAG